MKESWFVQNKEGKVMNWDNWTVKDIASFLRSERRVYPIDDETLKMAGVWYLAGIEPEFYEYDEWLWLVLEDKEGKMDANKSIQINRKHLSFLTIYALEYDEQEKTK